MYRTPPYRHLGEDCEGCMWVSRPSPVSQRAFRRAQLIGIQFLPPGPYRYNTIRHLCLNAVLAGEGLEESVAAFLGAFPGLTVLTIRTFPRGPINEQRLLLQQMRWSDQPTDRRDGGLLGAGAGVGVGEGAEKFKMISSSSHLSLCSALAS